MMASCENQRVIIQPRKLIYMQFGASGEERFLTGKQIHYHQTVLVALIAVTLHRLPGNIRSIR